MAKFVINVKLLLVALQNSVIPTTNKCSIFLYETRRQTQNFGTFPTTNSADKSSVIKDVNRPANFV